MAATSLRKKGITYILYEAMHMFVLFNFSIDNTYTTMDMKLISTTPGFVPLQNS